MSVSTLPVNRSFRAHPSALSQVREFVREQAGLSGVDIEAQDDLVLAVSEACVNSVIHSSSARVVLSWRCFDSQVEVTIKDEGIFDRKVPMPEFDGTAGRGIPIILALVDEVTISEGTPARPGTTVRFLKRVGSRQGRQAAI